MNNNLNNQQGSTRLSATTRDLRERYPRKRAAAGGFTVLQSSEWAADPITGDLDEGVELIETDAPF